MNAAVETERQRIYEAVSAAALRLYGKCPDFSVSHPSDAKNGDFAASAALALGKVLRRPPILTAAELASEVKLNEGERAQAAGKGFINFFLKPSFLHSVLKPWTELPKFELPSTESPDFLVLCRYCHLRTILLLHAVKGGAELSLLSSESEKRLLWAVALEDIGELANAAEEFYDKCTLRSDYLPLRAARCLLLNNALRVMAELLSRKEIK